MWSPNKFRERLIVMRDLLSTYEDKGELPELMPEDNPFYDAPQPQLIGEGYYMLEPLANLIDNPAQINLIGRTFEVFGKLNVNIIPVDQDGNEDLPDEMIPDEPEDLIGSRIDYVIKIEQAVDLPFNFCRDTFVEYQLYLNEEKFRTPSVKGNNRNPIFDYSNQHTQEYVTDGFIKYLKEDFLIFRVYGFVSTKRKHGDKQDKSIGSMGNTIFEQSTVDLSADLSK